jgi:trans-aconitate methyltransferase
MLNAFFELHSDLPREGPGEPADVAWATALAGVPADARICDAGCGPGADIAALLDAAPGGHVTAIEAHAAFVAAAARCWQGDPRVTVLHGDMARIGGPFDLIWCAGALYFLGLAEGLRLWREALAPGGLIAFSEPCYFVSVPSEAARAVWEGEGTVRDRAGIEAGIAAAGYRLLGTRVLSDASWEAYYTPMEARIAALAPGAGPDLAQVLDEGRREIALWRAARTETGYLLCVVAPA